MSRYSFSVEATISMSVDVEANDLASAIEAAQQAGVMSLCHQCSRGEEGAWNTSGELDCDPASSPLTQVLCDDEDVDLSSPEIRAHGWGTR